MAGGESGEQEILQNDIMLQPGRAPRYTINTGGSINTDVAAAAQVAPWCRAFEVYANTNPAYVQFGEPTSGTIGAKIAPGVATVFKLPAGAASVGDGKVHAQSPNASTIVDVTELGGA